MYRLISFLSSYRNVIFFLVLEMIAFRMLVRFNDHQRHRYGDEMLELRGSVQQVRASIQAYQKRAKEYDNRVGDIQGLQGKVDSLETLLNAYRIQAGALQVDSIRLAIESQKSEEKFSYIPCRVIKNNVDRLYNYITIDKGLKAGIKPDMGIVSPNGIVGRVIRVSDHYALVLSALNLGFKLTLQTVSEDSLSASIGVYEWDGINSSEARLTYIPETVELRPGTQVVTSGFSTVFPGGYPVGTVTDIGSGGEDGFYDATIQLSTDFHSLWTVFAIESLHKPELDSLSQEIETP